jgi:hypothetical protein
MLELLAFAPEDGWAYYRVGSEVWLLRPPYTKASSSVATQGAVSAACSRYGFVPPPPGHETYRTLASLLEFLGARIV